jgi:hypothetical protein
MDYYHAHTRLCFIILILLTHAYSQTVMACGGAIPSPEVMNEIENENDYEKTHDLMRILVLILVLVLRPPSLTLPE